MPKHQGACGSCWAFATVAALEAIYALATAQPQSFSEQQLIDCAVAPNYMNLGCDGGVFPDAMKYVKENQVVREAEYPYRTQ